MEGITPEAAELLKGHCWSGNIRELQNCIEKAVILSDSSTLTAADIELPHGRTSAADMAMSGNETLEENGSVNYCNNTALSLLGIATFGHIRQLRTVSESLYESFLTVSDGTGIGLSLSRQIMRLHNGSLKLTRSDAQSTVFTLIFK